MSEKDWLIVAFVPRRELLSGLDATRRLVAILIAANVIVEFIFIVLFARRFIIQPIRRLLEGTREVLAGNYQHRVDVKSRDEFGQLATSFNIMTGSLESTLEELRGRESDLSKADELLRQKLEQLEHGVKERARTAAALRDQSELLRALHSAIPAPIFYKSLDGAYLGCNAAFARMLNLTEDEVTGRTVFDVAPATTAALTAEHDRLLVERGTSVSHEATLAGENGSLSHFVVHKSVFRRGDEVGGIVGVMLDITQRRALEAQLVHSQKLEAVGVLASGIAHDFNNVLQVITSYAQVLLAQSTAGDSLHQPLLQVQRAAERASDLVRDLLTFGRKEVSKLQAVDLNLLIEHTARLLERTIPRMIRVELSLAKDLGRVEADASQLEQVLVNLATNARDAMPEGGVLHIATSTVAVDEEFCRVRPDLTPGPHALIRVADTGVGMDAATMSRVFEPFFTTKEVGMGTGLGLASVYGIVRGHRGHIECRSLRDHGTEFDVYLPFSRARERDRDAQVDTLLESSGGGETILVVDDDPGVLEASELLLQRIGHEVRTAASGEEALEICRGTGDRPDLVILDLGMPGMGGRRCLGHLLELDPELKVIIATGYGTEEEELAMRRAGARDFIAKPYRAEELWRKIRGVLDGVRAEDSGGG